MYRIKIPNESESVTIEKQNPNFEETHLTWKIGLCITFWKLWNIRNSRIFEGDSFTVDGVIKPH